MSLIKYDPKWMDKNGFLSGALSEATGSNQKGKGVYPFNYLTGECVIPGGHHKKTEISRPLGITPMWLPFYIREREVIQQIYYNASGDSLVPEANLLPAVAIIRMGGISVRLGQSLDYNNNPDVTNTVERWVTCIGPDNELSYEKNLSPEYCGGSNLLNLKIIHTPIDPKLVPLNLQVSCNELAFRFNKDYVHAFGDLLRDRLTGHELVSYEVSGILVEIYRKIQATNADDKAAIDSLFQTYYDEIYRSVKVSDNRKKHGMKKVV